MSASAGRVLLLFKGEYSALTTYTAMDAAFYNGSTYVAKQTTLGNVPTDTTYWQILCQGQLSGNFYGTSATAGATAEKAVTIPADEHFILQQGDVIGVVFTNENTANNPTLNVNSTGAKPIKYNGTVVTTSELWTAGEAGILTMFQYDGTNWVWFAHGIDYNTTYTPEKLGIGIGECATAASTTAKEATLTGYELKENGIVSVKFTYAVPAGSTLNVNSKGAKAIYYQGAAIVDQVIRAGYTATFQYDGTNYVLICVDKSAGHEIKNPSGTTMTQRSALKFVGGVSVTDDSTNDQTIINAIGHTIVDSDDTDMAQRADLQFLDAHLTDDDTNDKTEVEVIKSVASADYSLETEDGLYLIPDGDGSVIEPASEDYVEVEQVTGGTKTYGELLNELRTKIDASKLTDNAVLKEINGNDRNIYNFCYQYGTSSAIQFSRASHNNGGATTVVMDFISGSYYVCVGTNRENRSSNTAPEGYKLTLYYGNKKAVVDLQTTANRCWYDSSKTVKQKIDEKTSIGVVNITNIYLNDLAWSQDTAGKYYALIQRVTSIGSGILISAIITEFAKLKASDVIQLYWLPGTSDIKIMSNVNSFTTNATISIRLAYIKG